MSNEKFITEIIPFIPVTNWEYDHEVHYTGHIYYKSPYECDNNCGTCDGGACDFCHKVENKSISCNLTTDKYKMLLSAAFPDMGWEQLPSLPSIMMVYDCFPELYKAIVSYLNCPDIIQEQEDKIKEQIQNKILEEAQEAQRKQMNEDMKRMVYILSSLAESGFMGSLKRDPDCFVKCKTVKLPDGRSTFVMESGNYKKLRSCIPNKLLECLDNNMTDTYFVMESYDDPYNDDLYKYNIPKAWLDDMGIYHAYRDRVLE